MEAACQYAPLTFWVSAASILQDRHTLKIVRQPPKASRSYHQSTPPTPPFFLLAKNYHPSPESRSTHQLHLSTPFNRSTRWTGQTCLTNSQATNHERWMVRFSRRAPGFSREQSTCESHTKFITYFVIYFVFFSQISLDIRVHFYCIFVIYVFYSTQPYSKPSLHTFLASLTNKKLMFHMSIKCPFNALYWLFV